MEHVAFVEGRGNLIIQYSADEASAVGKEIIHACYFESLNRSSVPVEH